MLLGPRGHWCSPVCNEAIGANEAEKLLTASSPISRSAVCEEFTQSGAKLAGQWRTTRGTWVNSCNIRQLIEFAQRWCVQWAVSIADQLYSNINEGNMHGEEAPLFVSATETTIYIGQRWLYEELFLLDLGGITAHLHINNTHYCFSTDCWQ